MVLLLNVSSNVISGVTKRCIIHRIHFIVLKVTAERNAELRQDWLCKLGEFEASQLLFVDESATNERTGDRKYGWALFGLIPHVIQPLMAWDYLDAWVVDIQ